MRLATSWLELQNDMSSVSGFVNENLVIKWESLGWPSSISKKTGNWFKIS